MSRRGRILVIDDEPRMGKALQRLLAPSHDVVAVQSAREALALASGGEAFDVVLCDLMMPGMNGMELHAELARVQPGLAARMVFMTGGAYTPAAQRFMETVPNRRLEKPFKPEVLEALLADMLGAGGA
ncbi:MAG TPA: response regulator [Anaeromyxobacteraceae bacterium]|nr:response regulator [Anaeromyxobacteraceae bacterium]